MGLLSVLLRRSKLPIDVGLDIWLDIDLLEPSLVLLRLMRRCSLTVSEAYILTP